MPKGSAAIPVGFSNSRILRSVGAVLSLLASICGLIVVSTMIAVEEEGLNTALVVGGIVLILLSLFVGFFWAPVALWGGATGIVLWGVGIVRTLA